MAFLAIGQCFVVVHIYAFLCDYTSLHYGYMPASLFCILIFLSRFSFGKGITFRLMRLMQELLSCGALIDAAW